MYEAASFKKEEIYRFKDLEYGGKIEVPSAGTTYFKLLLTEKSSFRKPTKEEANQPMMASL